MQAVIAAGASSVNTFFKGGLEATPPSADALAAAVAQATEQAKVLVQAAAKSAGLTLGNIRSIDVQAPSPWYSGPNLPSWRVQVVVTYDVAQ